jgi:hypothetical protein
MKRLGLALHNYHSSYKQLPPSSGGTYGNTSAYSNQGRLSGFAAILPFIEQQAAWEVLANPVPGTNFPSMGPSPSYDPSLYTLWATQFDAFICPEERTPRESFGLRSYMFCYGDGIDTVGKSYYHLMRDGQISEVEMRNQRAACRGAFVPGRVMRFRDILDGLANTMLVSETAVKVAPSTPKDAVARNVEGLVNQPSLALKISSGGRLADGCDTWSIGKGSMWAEGSFIMNAFTSVLPPNSPSATVPNDADTGVVSATSHHSNGVYVLMGDGAVRFVSASIDTGDTSAREPARKSSPQNAKPTFEA